MKYAALHRTNGSDSRGLDYTQMLTSGGGWTLKEFSSETVPTEEDEVSFTRKDFFAALEASAAELNSGLNKLEQKVPKEELQEWLSAFNKPE